MGDLVLATGGSGYIAGWCIVELLRRGYDVRTTIRTPGREALVTDAVATVVDPAGRLRFAVADLTKPDGWTDAMRDVDYALHVASPLGLLSNDPTRSSPPPATAPSTCSPPPPRQASNASS